MTNYVETANVAHVMRWVGNGRWGSVCWTHGGIELDVNKFPYVDGVSAWPVRRVDEHQPAKPWCSRCVAVLERQADEVERDVLEPARIHRELVGSGGG